MRTDNVDSLEFVLAAVRGERAYQEALWGPTLRQGRHTTTEFLVYLQDYTKEALHVVTRKAAPEGEEEALRIVRKVAALAVACMEQHGALTRDMADLDSAEERHAIK